MFFLETMENKTLLRRRSARDAEDGPGMRMFLFRTDIDGDSNVKKSFFL